MKNLANKNFQEIVKRLRNGEKVPGYRANKVKPQPKRVYVSEKQRKAVRRGS